MPDQPVARTVVNNHDVLHADALIRRFQSELMLCVSALKSEVNEFDQKRAADYLAKLALWVKFASDEPQLDLPASQPASYILEPEVTFPDVTNESINTLLRLFAALRIELLHSQSALAGSGLQTADKVRADALITKMQKFLVDYVAKAQPTDYPESAMLSSP